MNFRSCLLLLIVFLSTVACQPNESSLKQANIILFLVDDMGWQDTSEPFWEEITALNRTYRTPNMERLAREGAKFTQAYATSVCSPTRVSLITGMNAARHRVTNWTLHKNEVKKMEVNHESLDFPLWNVNGISPTNDDSLAVYATPLAQVLNNAGYLTVHVGKAHLGAIGTVGEDPLSLGFDVNIAGHAAGAPGSYLGQENYGNGIKGKEVWAVPGLEKYHGQDVFLTEALTLEAVEAMNSAVEADKPFFLYMSHYAVHSPIMADERFVQKYYDKGIDSIEAKYTSLVEGMDKSLGDLMDYLNAKEIADNTIILFMSDNGGLSAVIRGGEAHTHNKPLSSGKGSMHEGGIRVPMLVKWPGVVKKSTIVNEKVIIEDFYPTILEMAGLRDVETPQIVDGVSFVPLLEGKKETDNDRALIWHFPNEWGPTGPGIGAASAIRKGDYKLIFYHNDQRLELFNIAEDIGETTNLAEKEENKTKELLALLSEKLLSMNAQMPSHKKSGEIVKIPSI